MTTTVFSTAAAAGASDFEHSPLYAELKNSAYEHLLSRIEELGAEFGRWSQAAIAQFVMLELDSYIRLHAVPVNELEAQSVAHALTRELTAHSALAEQGGNSFFVKPRLFEGDGVKAAPLAVPRLRQEGRTAKEKQENL